MDRSDKFDKFSRAALKALSLAQEAAQKFQHNYIGTEHLLLGLVREGEGVAAKVLSNLGVELNKVRNAIEFIIGRGDQMVSDEIGLTPRAQKVIELAIEEAQLLKHNYIGTQHLLLGLVREGEGIAAEVLKSLGVKLEDVRLQTRKVLDQGRPATDISTSATDNVIYACSFCQKSRDAVGYLIAGGKGASICSECVLRSREIIKRENIKKEEEKKRARAEIVYSENAQESTPNQACSFCEKGRDVVGSLITGSNERYICDECVMLCQEIIEEETEKKRARDEKQKFETEQLLEEHAGNTKEATLVQDNQSIHSHGKDQVETLTKQIGDIQAGHVFLAYSRRDFYFTESLFYALYGSGVKAWMDVWKITPGDNWEHEIHQALESSQGVVLVATRESLRSPFVRDEICQAYQANKPIYLVIRGHMIRKDLQFEHEYVERDISGNATTREKMRIDLYDYAQVFIDMRAGFRKGVAKLVAAINTQQAYRKRLPGPLNRKTEPILAVVWITLFLLFLMVLTEIWKYGSGIVVADLLNQVMGYIRDIHQGHVGEVLFLVPAAIAHYFSLFVELSLVLFLINFLRRQEVQASDFFNVMLRDVLGVGFIILLQDVAGVYENLTVFFSASDIVGHGASSLPIDEGVLFLSGFHLILYVLLVILLLVFCVMFNVGDGRGAILRWLPTGKASQTIRWKGNAAWIKKLPDDSVSPAPNYRSYAIVASAEDVAIAREIKLLLQHGRYKTTDRREDAQCDLVILSPFADDGTLKEAYQRQNAKPIIYVLARSIKPSKGTLTRIQWIDYRRPTADQFWKQWERNFKQLKGKQPVFPYVPENQLKSLISQKHGNGIRLMLMVVGWGSAWLLSCLEYLMFVDALSHIAVPVLSTVGLLLAIGLNYMTLIQILRGSISLVRVRGRLFMTGLLSIIASLIAHNGLLIVSSLIIAVISYLVTISAQKSILTWLPLRARRIKKRSLLQPITFYRALTSREHLLIVIAGLVFMNTVVVNGWIIPPLTRQAPLAPYAVTVPGPYNLASPGLWAQDPSADAFNFHFTYQPDALEVSQNRTTTGGESWIEFLGTNAYPRQFATHFRSSIHIQFTSNDPRTTFSMLFDDASNQAFTLLGAGFWQISGSGTPGYTGRIVGQGQAPGYTLEVEVNGILCTYEINGQKVATVANTAISSINNMMFMTANFNPNGTRLYLSHFTYTPLAGPALSRSAASQLVDKLNNAAYTTPAPGWNCNPTVERWNALFEPASQSAALDCSPTGTRVNQPTVLFDFDNGGFGGLPDTFTYSFHATFQGSLADQCLFAGLNIMGNGGIDYYIYDFAICANGTWATQLIGYHLAHLKVFLGQAFTRGHIQKQRNVALRITVHSMTQDVYINNQLITSYKVPAPQASLASLLFGNGQGAVTYSDFSFVPNQP